MPDYRYIFFDLDGTLTDPGLGITNSVMYALNRFGVEVPDRAALYPYIGPPLVDSFQTYGGLSAPDARAAVGYYREYFSERGIFENEVYPGVPALLRRLRDAGKRVVMATAKPEPYALRIAAHFGLAEYFDVIAGATLDETRIKKDQVIRHALGLCGGPDPGGVLMVGDREHDVRGAAACGVECLGVLYGYGSREELSAAGARFLAETVGDVGRTILE